MILMAVILLTLLAALATAQFAVAKSNTQSERYFRDLTTLHEYADSGISLALHDLKNNITENPGKLGTTTWGSQYDYGRDGLPSTQDEGEGDGIPTPGEANVTTTSVGPSSLGAGLITYVGDSGYAGVQRLIATASTNTGMVTVTTFVRSTTATMPKVAALYVDPDVVLDLKGNSFLINGNDHLMDGTPVAGNAKPGIATGVGTPAGSNKLVLLAQIPSSRYNQVIGLGTNPSVAEAGGVNLEDLFGTMKEMKTQSLAPSTYTSPTFGTVATPEITYVQGDLHLSGQGTGAGVLVVDGSVTFTGQFTFKGLVIVMGDVRLTGGGAGIHIYGSLMVGESFTAVDTTNWDVSVSGNADVFYSSEALSMVESNLHTSYSVVYWDEN